MKEWQHAHSVERSQERGSVTSQYNQHDAAWPGHCSAAVWMLPRARSAMTRLQDEARAGVAQQAWTWGGTLPPPP